MTILLDTSVLGRLAKQDDPDHEATQQAISELHRRGERLCVTAQNLVEFRNFATRPVGNNGLGFSSQYCIELSAVFTNTFELLEENPQIFPQWQEVVGRLDVIGKQVHDARLMAVCLVHGVDQLLTYNAKHFLRFASAYPGFAILDPHSLTDSPPA